MGKLGLQARLFLSHVIVMLVGLITLVAVGRLYTPQLFVLRLAKLEERGLDLGFLRDELISGFESAWSRGALWSLLIGGSAAGGLSYLVSRRIMRPLTEMEWITQKFAAGNLKERVPANDIPEFNRLARSFNRMAVGLEGVEQRRRELVGDLTHELRTPLTILGGYLEGLADGTLEPSTEIFQRLARETARLSRLVNDLQELSKAEAGYLPINAQKVDLAPLLTSLVRRFVDQFPEEGPELFLHCPPNLPLVLADGERVEQILFNLLGNALRHTPQGSITLEVWWDTQVVWVAVIDTGQGIAPEDLPHIFERFWRSDRSRARESGGTGIGLSITRRLVELMGGQIEVESTLHQGSEFRFSLPLA